MEGRVEKTNKMLPGVKCVVNTCHYHIPGDYCSAQQIEIQPRNAKNTQETDCATFVINRYEQNFEKQAYLMKDMPVFLNFIIY